MRYLILKLPPALCLGCVSVSIDHLGRGLGNLTPPPHLHLRATMRRESAADAGWC
jgi:hypothetical protein